SRGEGVGSAARKLHASRSGECHAGGRIETRVVARVSRPSGKAPLARAGTDSPCCEKFSSRGGATAGRGVLGSWGLAPWGPGALGGVLAFVFGAPSAFRFFFNAVPLRLGASSGTSSRRGEPDAFW